MSNQEELREVLARKLHSDYENQMAGYNIPLRKWDELGDGSKEGYYSVADLMIRTLGLRWEWGAQMDTHIGRIHESRAGKGFAKVLVEEINEDQPTYNAKLARRVVGQWEE